MFLAFVLHVCVLCTVHDVCTCTCTFIINDCIHVVVPYKEEREDNQNDLFDEQSDEVPTSSTPPGKPVLHLTLYTHKNHVYT